MGGRGSEEALRVAALTALWAALCLIWGSTWLFIKVGLADLPPFGFAGLRFLIAVLPILAWIAARRTPLPRGRGDWTLIAVTGFLSIFAGYGLVFWAEQHIASGLTAILFTTYGVFGLLLAHAMVPGEPLVFRKVLGVILGIAGIVLIFWDQLRWGGRLAVWGSLAVVLAAAIQALGGVLMKTRGGHLDPAVVTAGQMLVGTGPLLLVGFLTEGNPLAFSWTPRALFSLFYLALVGSSLAFVLWYALLRRVEVTKAQTVPLVNTLVAVFLGWLVLGEKFGAREAVGGAAILLGTALVLTTRKMGAAKG